jgi:hypothetical protein
MEQASQRLRTPGWEYLIFDALQIDLPLTCWPQAREMAIEAARTSRSRLSASSRWGPLDHDAHGYMAEAALAQLLGIEYAWELTGRTNGPDVAGFEVKSTAWGRGITQADYHGGRYWVKATTAAEAVVFCSLFEPTRHKSVYLDGWLPMATIRRAGQETSGKGGYGRSIIVPYTRLWSWRTRPELADGHKAGRARPAA